MIQFFAALGFVPVRVIFEQFDVKTVEPRRSLDVKGILADLLDGRDARQRQEKSKVVRKIGVITGDRFTINGVLSLKTLAVSRQNEFGFIPRRRRAFAQSRERARDLARRTNLQMDVITLKHTAGQVRLV